MSEKSITRQQAGRVRRAKTSRRNPADLAGACSGGKFVVSRAGEAYDARARGPNRKFRVESIVKACPRNDAKPGRSVSETERVVWFVSIGQRGPGGSGSSGREGHSPICLRS